MANNRLVFDGLDQLKAALRALPAELAAEASSIVLNAANESEAELRAAYPAITGALKRGLRVRKVTSGQYGAGAELVNTARHAWLYDNGSQARHWASGKSTGAMWGKRPPTHLFVRTVIKRRRAMHADLKALLERQGLQVSGDA